MIRNSRLEPSAVCLVCGNDIPAGEGLTARYFDRTLRFKCAGCLGRFEAEPEPYLAGHKPGRCKDEQESSPASEWRCDRRRDVRPPDRGYAFVTRPRARLWAVNLG